MLFRLQSAEEEVNNLVENTAKLLQEAWEGKNPDDRKRTIQIG